VPMMTRTQITAALSGKQLLGFDVGAYRSHGAFAHVFEGSDPAGRLVALKVLDIGAPLDARQEFQNEGRLLTQLTRQTGVVNLVRTGTDTIDVTLPGAGLTVPVPMEVHVLECADECLEAILALRSGVPWEERLHLFRGVVRGVHQMHLLSIAHRDLKSANCLVFLRAKRAVDCKVSDLGRATDYSKPSVAVPVMYLWGRGDPAFAPPEMLWLLGTPTSDAHIAADLYGVGSLLYEVATGQGLTATALGPSASFMHAAYLLSPAEREKEFRAALPDIASRFEVAFKIFDNQVPSVIRQPLRRLMTALCHSDPKKRGYFTKLSSRRHIDYNWVLERIDSMSRTIRFADAEARRIASRKEA
jgi:eukaryotic-like serine/threonine-protein kinase